MDWEALIGGSTGALRHKSTAEQERYADSYYEAIRNRKEPTDIKQIAENTQFSEKDIQAIRNHIPKRTSLRNKNIPGIYGSRRLNRCGGTIRN